MYKLARSISVAHFIQVTGFDFRQDVNATRLESRAVTDTATGTLQ